MYKLSQTEDLAFFVGHSLGRICVGSCDLQLHFSSEIVVFIQSAIGVRGLDSQFERLDSMATAAVRLTDFLNRVVVHASATKDGNLLLQFFEGTDVLIIDDSEQFESFSIRVGERLIVV